MAGPWTRLAHWVASVISVLAGRAVQLSKTTILPSKTPGAGRLRKLGDPRRPPP
jgi:hypothetical protein